MHVRRDGARKLVGTETGVIEGEGSVYYTRGKRTRLTVEILQSCMYNVGGIAT